MVSRIWWLVGLAMVISIVIATGQEAEALPSSSPTLYQVWGTQVSGEQNCSYPDPRSLSKPYGYWASSTLSDSGYNNGLDGGAPCQAYYSYSVGIPTGTIKFTASESGNFRAVEGQMYWQDVLFVNVPNASPTTLTNIEITHTGDGTASGTYQFTDDPLVGVEADYGDLSALGPTNIVAINLIKDTIGPDTISGNWVDPATYAEAGDPPGVELWTGSFEEDWDVTVEGSFARIPLGDVVDIYELQNGFLDFGDTSAFNVVLPPGVTATSASGQFLTQPLDAPEPSSLAMFLTSTLFLSLAAVRRCRHVSHRHVLRGPQALRTQRRSMWLA